MLSIILKCFGLVGVLHVEVEWVSSGLLGVSYLDRFTIIMFSL